VLGSVVLDLHVEDDERRLLAVREQPVLGAAEQRADDRVVVRLGERAGRLDRGDGDADEALGADAAGERDRDLLLEAVVADARDELHRRGALCDLLARHHVAAFTATARGATVYADGCHERSGAAL